MERINKGILLPLLAAIATFLKQAFGIEVPDEWLDATANLVLFAIMLLGIFMSPKKPKKKEVEQHDTDDNHEFAGLDVERESAV
ncbi:hypothetical protein DNH61_11855 [Paenibacillus sambharensis]|uniref:Holin n=1 Tax=Paenibacillus sambharensis TaxID=1803190 RepID=A0A2W1LUR8_9BACL|nr:hypothetical protein [Paenibacillus sambharensis]PZD95247.1 hypothetical protein DNH61_11855 [Paenibacillus sambharensis]